MVSNGAPRSPKLDVAAAVEVRGLVKRYGTTTAVSGASFTVADGEILRVARPERCRQDDHFGNLGRVPSA